MLRDASGNGEGGDTDEESVFYIMAVTLNISVLPSMNIDAEKRHGGRFLKERTNYKLH